MRDGLLACPESAAHAYFFLGQAGSEIKMSAVAFFKVFAWKNIQ